MRWVRRRAVTTGNLSPSHKHSRGEGGGLGRQSIFPTSKQALYRKEIVEYSGCGEPALSERVQQVSKGTLSLPRTGCGSM